MKIIILSLKGNCTIPMGV